MRKPAVSALEWRLVTIAAVAIMILVSLPYMFGAAAQDADWHFGWFIYGTVDGNSYLAKMREGAVDGWLFHIAYTSEPHDGAFLFTPYLAGGKLAALFTSPRSPTFVDTLLIVFHGARILFGIALILVMYRFIAVFIPRRSLRLLALVLACLGGGLGWLIFPLAGDQFLGSPPIDILLPEGYSFYILQGLPHLELARAALFGGLLITFHATTIERRWGVWMVAAGLSWLVMGLCVPFYIGVVYAILGVWGAAVLIRHRRFPLRLFTRCVVGAMVPAPLLLYSLYVILTNPVIRQWQAQNVLPSPNPIHFVLGYGIYVLLAIPVFRWAWRRGHRSLPHLLIVAWVAAGPVLAYFPIAVQRRLLEGIFVPLCIMAVWGMNLWWIGMRRRLRRRSPIRAMLAWRRAVLLILGLTLPTSILLLLIGAGNAQHRAEPLFHSSGEIAVLDWMNANLPADSVVLCDFSTGNYLPARADLRVFIGHSPETLYIDTIKRPLMMRFYGGALNDAQQRDFFATYGIRYVLFSPEQQTETVMKALSLVLHLLPYNRADGYRIYEVASDGS
ncbi:MAG TPA: hypothetical protein VMT34_06575 [Aggregatilineales bacterium]|nr:hypothetical protein [Aggregatilineales bacterium]